jgi:hypothetical protein
MDMLLHSPWWIWLLVSVVPYSIERRKTPEIQSLVLNALFWNFCIKYQKGHCSWSFSLPWIKQIKRTQQWRTRFISAWKKLLQEWMKQFLSS